MLRARVARIHDTGPDFGHTTGQKFKWLYSDDNSGNSLAMLMPEKLIKKTGKEQKKSILWVSTRKDPYCIQNKIRL